MLGCYFYVRLLMYQSSLVYSPQFDLHKIHDYDFANKTDLNFSNYQLREQELAVLADAIIKAKNLKKLDFSNNLLTSAACKKLALILSHFKQLEYLDLSHNSIRDTGLNLLLPVLTQLDNLKVLKLNHCRLVNVKNFANGLGKITHLELSKNQIEIGLGQICSPYLNSLIIQENHNPHRRQSLSVSEIKKIAAENKSLTLFDISNNQFLKKETIALQKHYPALQFIKNETQTESFDSSIANEIPLKETCIPIIGP